MRSLRLATEKIIEKMREGSNPSFSAKLNKRIELQMVANWRNKAKNLVLKQKVKMHQDAPKSPE